MKDDVLRIILTDVRDYLNRVLSGHLPDPGPLSVSVTGEKLMLLFDVLIDTVTPRSEDVVSGELSIERTVGGEVINEVRVIDPGTTHVTGLSGDDGSTVKLSFVWVDDAGNKSVNPATFEGVLLDTIAPADPGTLGIQITGEV